MKIANIIKYTLAIISLACIYLASGIKDVANWQEIAKPFFIIWFITFTGALIIANIHRIRRVTYPAFVCACSWSYKHKVLMTKFTRNTYRLYRWKNKSYSALYDYVQELFDIMYK